MNAPSRYIALAGLFALVLAGCEPASEPAVSHLTGPSLDLSATGYHLIEGSPPAQAPEIEVSRLIGVDGGTVHLAGHSIAVPRGAVTAPTVFTMRLVTAGYVEVELDAVVTDALGGPVDVGGNGFGGSTVALTLSYAAAKNVDDPSDLLVIRMLDDGGIEPLDVVVDQKARTVTAQLDHFSKYCLASN